MSRILSRLTGGGAGGIMADGDYLTLVRGTAMKSNFDLLELGCLGRNVLAGGDLVTGIDASATGDVDLLNWTPLLLDNSASQFSGFTDANSATLVIQFRFLLRVSNAAITITPKVRYGSTITTITTVATLATPAACSATASDFSGSNQYQTVTMTLPSGVQLYKPQITIAGTVAAGYQAWARAWFDMFVQS